MLTGEYNDMDLKNCLVGIDSQNKAVVFYKGSDEIGRIPTEEIAAFSVEPDIDSASVVTSFNFKADNKHIISIFTRFNSGSSGSGTKVPGFYVDTRSDTYLKFIDFLRENTLGASETSEKKLEIVIDYVKKLNAINRAYK